MRQFYFTSLTTWLKNIAGGLLVLSLLACASNRLAPLEHAAYRTKLDQAATTHPVRTGETLYAIAWRYDQDYRELARYNGLTEPFAIRAGQTIYLTQPHQAKRSAVVAAAKQPRSQKTPPPPAKKSAPPPAKKSAPSPAKKSAPPSAKKSAPPPAKKSAPPSHAPTTATHTNTPVVWQWPTQGEVVQRFEPNRGDKGIKISGRAGQAVKAAADGVVAYSGSGLRGYGQLLIIKHNQDYLSAYAHNRKLLVKEGQAVKAGQTIAEMGHSEAAQVMLHFEIRKAGKPKDPLLYLRQIS